MLSVYTGLPLIFFELCLVLLRQAMDLTTAFSVRPGPWGVVIFTVPLCKSTRVALAEILSLDEHTHLLTSSQSVSLTAVQGLSPPGRFRGAGYMSRGTSSRLR